MADTEGGNTLTDEQIKDILAKPYHRVVCPDEDAFLAQMLEFPGCLAGGNTQAEALQALEEGAAGWLIATAARGQPIPEPTERIWQSRRAQPAPEEVRALLKSCLLVLCTARDGQSWDKNMLKDFDFCIEAIRALGAKPEMKP